MDAEQLCFDESPVPPSQPLEELSPPPIAFDTIVWVAGRGVLKEEGPKPKPKRIRIDVEDE